MADEFVVRPKEEDDDLRRRIKDMEDREASRKTWNIVRWGLCIGTAVLTGVPILLPGDGGDST